MRQGLVPTRSREFRILVGLVVLVAVGSVIAGVVSSARNGPAYAEAAPLSAFVPIQDVEPNVWPPRVGRDGSTGVFTVDCGTNRNRKFSPDNPVAAPGVKNAAQHVHDFVGNLSISAGSSDESLAESATTCRNGDRSSYFWPVLRINRAANPVGPNAGTLKAAGPPAISCPTVANRLPAIPAPARAEVQRNLALLDEQLAEANQRLVSAQGQGGPNFIDNAIIGPLQSRRAATLDRIAIAIGRSAPRPTGLVSLAGCELSYDGGHAGHAGHSAGPGDTGGSVAEGGAAGGGADGAAAVTPTVNCPTVRDKLPGVPASALDEVNRNLELLDKQIAEANQRLVTARGQGGPNFIDNAIVGPLRGKRAAVLDRIAIAIGRSAPRPTGLADLARCTLDNPGQGGADQGGAEPPPAELPGVEGPNLEVAGNVGRIVRPAQVRIEYRGNPTSRVVPMPMFLKALTGESKPTSRGPANARKTWTCSGFADRLTDTYVVCPPGSRVLRVHDFPSCWDGKNTDSANHRSHIAFPDPQTGACPADTVAVPQVRITIAYDIPQRIQRGGQFQLDSFPEENHNPASDHNDFVNVNSVRTMNRIVDCLNAGRRCH